MSEESYKNYPVAHAKKQSFLSLVWLIPLVAVIVAAWLMYKVYSEKGPTIIIDFENARGIEVSRTHIRYKDVDVGKVKNIKLERREIITDTGEKIIQDRALVTAELKSFMSKYLGEDTVFWVVRPRVSMGEVSGLSTLFSGFYIEMDPGKAQGEAKESYVGLDKPPKITSYDRGKIFILNAKNLGSLNEGSPVYYHQLKVGEVIGSQLNTETDSVDISIYIKDKYSDKVRSNTQFWNVSGIDVEVTASGGISAKMESLAALVIGGLAFDTKSDDLSSQELSGSTVFPLYDSYKMAKEDTSGDEKLYYKMYFNDTLFGLVKDSTVEYQGVQVGKVESIILQVDGEKGEVKTIVKASILVDKLSDIGDRVEAEDVLSKLVSRGLQGQLQTSSLLTGAQYIALIYPDKKSSSYAQLQKTQVSDMAVFPTTAASSSLLNFDASELTGELTKTVQAVRKVISSKDVKQIIANTGQLAKNISTMTKDLNDKGISGELVNTLQETRKAIVEIQKTAKAAEVTMKTAQGTINRSLGEDSALQYKLQVMLDDLSETANSFSVLADTLQRKPNSVLFGK